MSRIRLKTLALFLATFVSSTNGHADVPIPCAGPGTKQAPVAVAAVEQTFRSLWRDASPNWYTAFEVPPPKRNPFDRTADREPAVETVKGMAWAHGVYCLATASPDGTELLVRYFARVAAFHEGQAWSRTFSDGLIAAFLTRKDGEIWRVSSIDGERTILLPNAIRRLPDIALVPEADVKAGIPCRSGTAWNGQICMRVSAASRQR